MLRPAMVLKRREGVIVAGSRLVVLTEQRVIVGNTPKPFIGWYKLSNMLDDNNYPIMAVSAENNITRSDSCVNSLHESLMDPSSQSYYDYTVEGSLKVLWFSDQVNQTRNTLHKQTRVFVVAQDGIPEPVQLETMFKAGKYEFVCAVYNANTEKVEHKAVTFSKHLVTPRDVFLRAKISTHVNNIIVSQGLIIGV